MSSRVSVSLEVSRYQVGFSSDQVCLAHVQRVNQLAFYGALKPSSRDSVLSDALTCTTVTERVSYI